MSIEAMKLALEALAGVAEWVEMRPRTHPWDAWQRVEPAITALRQAIEQAQSVANQQLTTEQAQKQEPVRIMGFNCVCGRRMEVSAEQGVVPAPQRQPLTEEQIQYAFRTNSVMVDDGNAYMVAGKRAVNIARAIEAAHGIKGEA